MDIAYEIAQYLDDGGFGTLAIDIFVGSMPAEQDGIYVFRLGGTFNNYVPIEETTLNIYVKATKDAITTIENIKRFIHRMHTTDTANAHIYSMLVIGDVEDMDVDLEYAKEYKITVVVTHRATSLIS